MGSSGGYSMPIGSNRGLRPSDVFAEVKQEMLPVTLMAKSRYPPWQRSPEWESDSEAVDGSIFERSDTRPRRIPGGGPPRTSPSRAQPPSASDHGTVASSGRPVSAKGQSSITDFFKVVNEQVTSQSASTSDPPTTPSENGTSSVGPRLLQQIRDKGGEPEAMAEYPAPSTSKAGMANSSGESAKKSPLLGDTDSPKDEDEYEVEKIVDYRRSDRREIGLYRVRWVDCESDEDTWEPLSNLSCPQLLKDFYLKRLSDRERAMPARKRKLQVPPDPRVTFEQHQAIANEILPPPDLAQLQHACRKNPNLLSNSLWSNQRLNESLNKAANQKKKDGTLLETLREQLLLSYLKAAKIEQTSRLNTWKEEINAMETVEIGVENMVDFEGPPRQVTYVTRSRAGRGVVMSNDPPIVCACRDCGAGDNPNCCPEGHPPYDASGRIMLSLGAPVYECRRRCHCSSKCRTRVVQNGRTVPLCIFRTNNGCGWGVKAGENIVRGSFVAEYVGEVITSTDAESRGKTYDADGGGTYLLDLDFNSGSANKYTIDAGKYGNVTRFINHSCDPNLWLFNVWIENLDPEMPQIAFFANRDIFAGEELTFNYQQVVEVDVDPGAEERKSGPSITPRTASSSATKTRTRELDRRSAKRTLERTQCKCGSKECRKFLF